MGINHKEAQRLRWVNTGVEERKRLGELHRAAVKKHWGTVDPEVRRARARAAAVARWGKEKIGVADV